MRRLLGLPPLPQATDARVEVDGCDLVTFDGGWIRAKDSWRKVHLRPV